MLRRLAQVFVAVLAIGLGALTAYEVYESAKAGFRRPPEFATYLGAAASIIGVEAILLGYLRRSRDISSARTLLRRAVTNDIRRRLDHVQLSGQRIELTLVSNQTGREATMRNFIDHQVGETGVRLTIIGNAGTGKSYTTLALAFRLLTDTRQLPVIVPLSHWQVGDSVAMLVTNFLSTNYGLSPTTARELFESKHVMPILDGLDEIDQYDDVVATATKFLDKLSEWDRAAIGARFVLTCQGEIWGQIPLAARSHAPAETWHITNITRRSAEQFLAGVLKESLASTLPEQILDAVSAAGLSDALLKADTLSMIGNVFERTGPGRYAETIDQIVRNGLVGEFVLSALRVNRTYIGRAMNVLAVAGLWRYAQYLDSNRAGVEISGRRLEDRDLRLHRIWPIAGYRLPRWVDFALAAILSAPGLVWIAGFLLAKGWLGYVACLVFYVVWVGLLFRTTSKAWVRPAILEFSKITRPRALLQQLLAAGVFGVLAYVFTGAMFAAIVFITVWLAIGLTVGFGQTLTTDLRVRELGPAGILRREHAISLISAVCVAPAVCYAFSLNLGAVHGTILGAAYVVVVGQTVGSALWRRYLALCLLLIPRSVLTPSMTFGRAYRLGMLRVNGTDYRFRSDEVQDFFATNSISRRTAWRNSRSQHSTPLQTLP